MKLNYIENKISRVSVHAQRPMIAHKLLMNQSPQQAINLIGNVYQICGRAQMYAASAAIEDCLQIRAEKETLHQRQQLVDMETLREHCWRIFMNWPAIIKQAADKNSLKSMLQIDSQWLHSIGENAFSLTGNPINPVAEEKHACLSSLEVFLEKTLFGTSPVQWLEMKGKEFDEWLQHCNLLSAKALNHIRQQHWAALGDSPTNHLKSVDQSLLAQLLSSEDADNFIQQPALSGHCFESTPLSRQIDHPLIQSLNKRFGSGLLTRMTALLVEIAILFEKLISSTEQITANYKTNSMPKSSGIGIVEAARGTLIHRVEIDSAKIVNYQIVAPTEWNFHPRGSLAKALGSLIASNSAEIHKQASLLIEAMDPCVRYSLEIAHHA